MTGAQYSVLRTNDSDNDINHTGLNCTCSPLTSIAENSSVTSACFIALVRMPEAHNDSDVGS